MVPPATGHLGLYTHLVFLEVGGDSQQQEGVTLRRDGDLVERLEGQAVLELERAALQEVQRVVRHHQGALAGLVSVAVVLGHGAAVLASEQHQTSVKESSDRKQGQEE